MSDYELHVSVPLFSNLHPLNLEKHFEIYRLYNSASNHHQIIWHAKDADGRAQGVDCLSTLIPF